MHRDRGRGEPVADHDLKVRFWDTRAQDLLLGYGRKPSSQIRTQQEFILGSSLGWHFEDSEPLDEISAKMLLEVESSTDGIAGRGMRRAQLELRARAISAAAVSGKQARGSALTNLFDNASWEIAVHEVSTAQELFGFAHQFPPHGSFEHRGLGVAVHAAALEPLEKLRSRTQMEDAAHCQRIVIAG